MPKTGVSYARASTFQIGIDNIQADARALAAAHYTLSDYEVIAVVFPDLSGVASSKITFSGLASVGGDKHWLNGFGSVRLITHEFGHNYGLFHANYLHPEEELGQALDYDLPGILEYGDIFDVMGDGPVPEGDMNMLMKNQLEWLPNSKVLEVTTDGTYRVHRFDHPSALANPTLALKVPAAGDVHYWIGLRQKFTSQSYNLIDGAYVIADHLGEFEETSLVDMTPESNPSEEQDRRDAGLEVGESFYDPDSGVTLTGIAKGGTAPNEWIDVAVSLGSRIGIADTAISVDEQRGTARVVVERRFGSSGTATVNYATVDGSAVGGSDYYGVSGTLIWADGDTNPKTILISLSPDAVAEGEEDFTLTLSGVTGGVLDGGASSCTISLVEPGLRMADFNPGYFSSTVRALAVQDDGKVLVGGSFDNVTEGGEVITIKNLMRLHADGSVDTTLVTGTGFNNVVNTMMVQDDGAILIGGTFTSYNGTPCNRLVRLNADGSVDGSFVAAMGTGPNGQVRDIAVEADGDILVAGDFSAFNGVSCQGVVRLTSAGARDTLEVLNTSFAAWGGVYSVLAEPDGKVMVAGNLYYNYNGFGFRAGVARLNADGSRDSSFETNAGAHYFGNVSNIAIVNDLIRLHDGKYLIGGPFTAYNGNAVDRSARINANGSFDAGFDPPAFAFPPQPSATAVYTLMEQASRAVVAGGVFTSPAAWVERLLSDGSVDPGFDQGSGPSGVVYCFTQDDEGAIYVGGNFFSYDGAESRPVVKISGGQSAYDYWVRENFTSAQIGVGDSAPDADPDEDNIDNVLEMAMGSNPNSPDSQSAFAVNSEDGIGLAEDSGESYLQVSFDKPASADGIWYAAQFSTDLQNWFPANPTPGGNATYEVIENTATRFTVRDKSPLSSNDGRSCRIRLMLAE